MTPLNKIQYLAAMSNRQLTDFLKSIHEHFQTLSDRHYFKNPQCSYACNLFQEFEPLIPSTLFELSSKEITIIEMFMVAYYAEHPNKKNNSAEKQGGYHRQAQPF